LLLEIKKVIKTFPGTVALDEVDFNLKKGEIHAIVGENGAGKSTLMKILSGAYKKDSGTIKFEDKKVAIGNVDAARALGISMIYQELENIQKLSVAENVFLGKLPRSRVPGFVNFKKLMIETKKILKEFDIDIDPGRKLASLTTAEQQFIEIIKAITVKNARIIIMDEPTSSLTKKEVEKLFLIIKELKKKGISIIYISHRLDEVVGIADRISIFRDGKNQGVMEKSEFDTNKIVSLMIGRELKAAEKSVSKEKKIIFEIKRLSIRNKIIDFNMKLYKGEILGIVGLMGSGKDELVKSIVGLWPAQSKEIYFLGKRINIKHPADAIKHGIIYLPEERKLQSLFLDMSVSANISPLWLFNVENKFFMNTKKEIELTKTYAKRLAIRTPSVSTLIVYLSGGNQQKVIFSRMLTIKPKLMILNDPTRGIDVGSKEEIYNIIKELASKGVSIFILSSEIQEMTRVANRVIVLSKGEIRDEFSDKDITTKNLIRSAMRV
jgi:ribose transport system ATP-binding protein